MLRCPTCYTMTLVTHELLRRRLPASWARLNPEMVITMFGPVHPAGLALRDLLNGTRRRVHAFGLPGATREAFVGALVFGWLQQLKGVQILDTMELSRAHFDKDQSAWRLVERRAEPTILQIGREMTPRVGEGYIRHIVERSVSHNHQLLLLTDFRLETHVPRYEAVDTTMRSARFDSTNIDINECGVHY